MTDPLISKLGAAGASTRARPILFSAPMVDDFLRSRQTQGVGA